MKKNIWIVVLFAATAVLAAVVVRQKQQIARMKEQSVSVATETPAARAPVRETPEPPTETKAVDPWLRRRRHPFRHQRSRPARARGQRATFSPGWPG